MYRVIKFDKSGLNPVEIAEMKNGSVAYTMREMREAIRNLGI